MSHTDLLKQAVHITWRYRALWVFGFFLALCGGGGGGGGGSGNFRLPSSSSGDFEEFGELPNLPSVDPDIIWAVVAGFICLIALLIVVGVVVRAVTRAALIGMVHQITETEQVTMAEGWQLGWSRRAWRLFLMSLLIGIPLAVVSILLILVAIAPLLLLIAGETALTVISIILTIFSCLFVVVLLIVVNAVVAPIQELAWRRTVLEQRGVFDSLREIISLVKRQFKYIAITWLLMFGIGFAWAIVSLVIVLPVSLIGAVVIGGIPAVVVYLISDSIVGAAIAGIPLALFVIIVIGAAASGFYVIFRSAVWTLTYLEVRTEDGDDPPPAELPPTVPESPTPEPQPEG
ncbi:MAG TPA: hypothetical protein VGD99_12390 [Anaerolineae bacterium]